MASPPTTLIIVSCGAAKIWDKYPQAGPTPARLAYTGTPFKVNREYAERFSDSWVILSAKYGFLDPEATVEGAYNVTFKHHSPPPIGLATLREQIRTQGLDRFDNVIGLGGRDYRAVIERTFSATRATLYFPFSGMALGKSLQAAKQAIASGKPLPT